MADEQTKDDALTPSQPQSLTRRSAALVRRGLESLSPKNVVKDSLGMEFKLIPAGTFMMGSDADDAEEDEKPLHEVTISKPFYMGIHPVTQSQWQEIMGDNPSKFIGDDHPVHGVSWDDAQEFIRKLYMLDASFEYRLPSEAEWEYACRAGTTGDYAGPLDSMAWYGNNSGQHYLDAAQISETDIDNYTDNSDERLHDNGNQTHPVGTKEANAFRLFDMHGNVWEWCQDFYDENYYRNSPSIDPQGPSSGQYRVLRGGSWDSVATLLRSALRLYGPPGNRGVDDGFRLVAVVRTQ